MGYSIEEFTSAGLTSLYPSYYKEFQVINWTLCDIVITESDGSQVTVLKEASTVTESNACVVIENITHNGLRINPGTMTSYHSAERVQLKGKRINVRFEDFVHSPLRIVEHNIIISTVEQSLVAKNMAYEINYGSMINESRVDVELIDPRFVFQVIDPNNQFDALLVNVFGQTVILRAGQFGRVIPSSSGQPNVFERPRLICYLRYPTEYYSGVKVRQTVFDIDIMDVYDKEPYQLSSGDYVCIATDTQSLSEVLAKRDSYLRGVGRSSMVSDKMIPKDVYDTAEANYKEEIERIKIASKKQLENEVTNRQSIVAKLQAQIATLTAERDAYAEKVKQWQALNEATTEFSQNKQKAEQAEAKARKDREDAIMSTIKIGGATLTAVLSFALTVLVKSKK